MNEEAKKVVMFCAAEQTDTDHTLEIDGNGEIVLTCDCGRFVKLPRDTTPDQLKAYIEAHKAANEGQISVASIEAKRAELLGAFDAPIEPEAASV